MDKEDWSILIGILVLIVSFIGVFIAYQTYSVVEPVEPVEDIDLFVTDVSKETGRSISRDFSHYGGGFDYDKKIIEEETYYTANIFMTNRGKRAHNVLLSFNCENIDFYGITKKPSSDFEIKYVSDWKTELYFPEVDDTNFQNWDIIFRVNNDINEFTCEMEYVSDDMEQKTKHVVINLN